MLFFFFCLRSWKEKRREFGYNETTGHYYLAAECKETEHWKVYAMWLNRVKLYAGRNLMLRCVQAAWLHQEMNKSSWRKTQAVGQPSRSVLGTALLMFLAAHLCSYSARLLYMSSIQKIIYGLHYNSSQFQLSLANTKNKTKQSKAKPLGVTLHFAQRLGSNKYGSWILPESLCVC